MRPTRRSLVLAAAAAPFAAALPLASARAQMALLSDADQALVKRATTYLTDLTEAHARFVQTDPRGQTSQGELYLKRPGKARFAYDPPSGLVVVSNGKTVFVADSRLKTFNHYPLFATPLSLFLARRIRLEDGVEVARVTHFTDGFTLTARDVNHQTAGHIDLTFTDSPLALEGWAVTDAQGRTTRIKLVGLQRASGLAPSLFEASDPRHPAGTEM